MTTLYAPHDRYQVFYTAEGLAEAFQCSVDTVLRIPRDKLPVYRVGKRNLYIPDDMIRFLRLHCRKGSDQNIEEILDDLC